MLLRKEPDGAVAINQPSHSWLSGQFARAWGNALFAKPAPFEAFCFAAEQHDIGWAGHDQAPVFDPEAGLPRPFRDVPATEHTRLWADGVRRARVFGAYPALLISLHARTIYDLTFDPEKASAENAAAVRSFLAEQEAVRDDLIRALSALPAFAEAVRPERIEENRLLLLAVDQLSLHLCWGVGKRTEIPDVPTRDGRRCSLFLNPAENALVHLDPWPFTGQDFMGQVEGRVLRRASGEAEFVQQFARSPLVALDIGLRPL